MELQGCGTPHCHVLNLQAKNTGTASETLIQQFVKPELLYINHNYKQCRTAGALH